VSGIENVTLAQFEPYQYPLYGMEITLTLNSKTEARIISEQVEQGAFNGDGYLPTMWGTDKGYTPFMRSVHRSLHPQIPIRSAIRHSSSRR
ncbi:MAG: hypothetical protein IKG82_13045, partial [Oscillospiraceae bacterium]|nr:hypothetical protein [Oscillospiraceae bacterium]